MNSNLVTQSNDLIRNISTRNPNEKEVVDVANKKSITLAIQQKRLIIYLVSKIKPSSERLDEVSVSFSEFCEVMDIEKGGKQFELIKQAVSQLASIVFWVESENKSILCSWLNNENCYVDWENKRINLQLSNTLSPFLLNLKQNFTAYQLGFTVGFKGKYTYRLYEYLRSYMGQGNYLFPLEKFQSAIADNKYKTVTDLERRVIKKSIEEINRYSDIYVCYHKIQKHPDKRSQTTHFEFIIYEKSDKEKNAIMSKWNNVVTGADSINEQVYNPIPTKKEFKKEEKWLKKYKEKIEKDFDDNKSVDE